LKIVLDSQLKYRPVFRTHSLQWWKVSGSGYSLPAPWSSWFASSKAYGRHTFCAHVSTRFTLYCAGI